jgi:hypothetical protein
MYIGSGSDIFCRCNSGLRRLAFSRKSRPLVHDQTHMVLARVYLFTVLDISFPGNSVLGNIRSIGDFSHIASSESTGFGSDKVDLAGFCSTLPTARSLHFRQRFRSLGIRDCKGAQKF